MGGGRVKGDWAAADEKGGAGKFWKGPAAGGTLDTGGRGEGGTDGSLNLPGGVGLKMGAPGLTGGPNDENGEGVWEGTGGAGRKGGGSDPATGPVDEKGDIVCPAAKGEEAGLAGKLGRPGFSIDYRTIEITRLLFDQNLRSITKPVRKLKK